MDNENNFNDEWLGDALDGDREAKERALEELQKEQREQRLEREAMAQALFDSYPILRVTGLNQVTLARIISDIDLGDGFYKAAKFFPESRPDIMANMAIDYLRSLQPMDQLLLAYEYIMAIGAYVTTVEGLLNPRDPESERVGEIMHVNDPDVSIGDVLVSSLGISTEIWEFEPQHVNALSLILLRGFWEYAKELEEFQTEVAINAIAPFMRSVDDIQANSTKVFFVEGDFNDGYAAEKYRFDDDADSDIGSLGWLKR